MKLTITANTLEEAEFGLGCIKSLNGGSANNRVVVRTVSGELDFSMVAVINKSPAGNYTAKVNQND